MESQADEAAARIAQSIKKSLKDRKVDFVSNHNGGTITEINLVTAVAPAAFILYSILQSRLKFFTPYGPPQFLCDFGLNAVAILLSVTLYSSFPIILNLLLLTPAIHLYRNTKEPSISAAQKIKGPENKKTIKRDQKEQDLELPKKAFITTYRGAMMVVTCVSILAVDFPVFPRRFAKVENWGTSLMDVGVGSFVFSSGIVSSRTILREVNRFQQSSNGDVKSDFKTNLSRRLSSTLKSSLPLLILGLVRLVMVKGTDYAEHVTEYGHHWNFFFTLSFLPPFVHLLQSFLFRLPRQYITVSHLPFVYSALTVFISVTYEILLNFTGLKTFVLIGDRNKYGIIGMNKEGISSFWGYLAIFLAGIATGSYLLPAEKSPNRNKSLQQSEIATKLLKWAVFWITFFFFVTEVLKLQVSRRLANLPYVLWIIGYNICYVMAFYLIEWFFYRRNKSIEHLSEDEKYKLSNSRILDAFNKEGLPIFLLANLLTGLVNLSVNTIDAERNVAMSILWIYIFVLTCTAVGLNSTNWRATAFGRLLGI